MLVDAKTLSPTELDKHIDDLKGQLHSEIERHRLLLKQLETVQARRKEIKADHDKHEIERIQQQIHKS
jgi:hypothetical protein